MDNTWATFMGLNPLEWGIDVVIESCTKYFSGHSDNFFCGVIACSNEHFKKIKQTAVRIGRFCFCRGMFQRNKRHENSEYKTRKTPRKFF